MTGKSPNRTSHSEVGPVRIQLTETAPFAALSVMRVICPVLVDNTTPLADHHEPKRRDISVRIAEETTTGDWSVGQPHQSILLFILCSTGSERPQRSVHCRLTGLLVDLFI